MKKEYDFSKGERGKFYNADAKFELPVYLDEDVRRHLTKRALARGVEVEQVVNEILRKEIAS